MTRQRAKIMTLFPLLGAVLLSTTAFAGSNVPMSSPSSVGMSKSRLERINVAMQRYIDRNEVAGVVTLVARRGKVVHFEAQGLRWAEEGEPIEKDTIFRIASMTKPITSVALMMLHEEGHFLLTDPISKWMPEYAEMKIAVPSEGARNGTPYILESNDTPITVRHILTHTAGFANSYRGLTLGVYREASQRQSEMETVGDFVTRFAQVPLNYEPGTKWEYSRATDHVGRLVELISGQTLDEFFKERIFKPLGMDDTHFYLPEEKLDRFAAQYSPGEDGAIQLADAPTADSRFVKEPHVYFMGAGGLMSTAADYWRFQQMMLNGGKFNGKRILGRKTVELMTENHTGDLPIWLRGPGYGFGLGYSVMTDRGQAGALSSLGSFGWGGAFCTYFWVDPVEDVVGILMTQVRPYTHLNIRQEFEVLVNQAIID